MSVASQVKKKISLEKTYTPEVKRIFSKMLRDFRTSVAGTGLPPSADKYRDTWRHSAETHAERVQRAFKGEFSGRKFFFFKQEDDESANELFALALLKWQEEFSEEQAELITGTNSSDQQTALQLARQALQEEGEPATNRNLAVAGAAILASQYNKRVQSIVMTQTQAAAESAKFIETEVESGQRPRVLGPALVVSNTEKTWRTVGDERVRSAHAAAEGQTKSLNEPFIVDGEALMFPGDTSLGASAGNVIGCRCVAIYRVA